MIKFQLHDIPIFATLLETDQIFLYFLVVISYSYQISR